VKAFIECSVDHRYNTDGLMTTAVSPEQMFPDSDILKT
jgi:hypothetical protein